MLLAIDVGNTNIVFGLFEKKNNGNLIGSFRLETRHSRTSDEYFALFQPNYLSITNKPSPITAIIISSVVPQTKYELEKFCKEHLKIKPTNVSDIKNKLGIKINIDNPEEVGADRLVNSVAAFSLHKKPAIILDFGTATTFDVIDNKGNYQGGVIAPGINLSIIALENTASKLPKISIEKPTRAIGKNTKQAMQSGIYYGYLGMIEKLIEEIKSELPKQKPLIIATGGLANFYKSSKIDVIDSDLTLKGLKIIYDRIL